MSKSKKDKQVKRMVHFSAKAKEAIKKEEKDSKRKLNKENAVNANTRAALKGITALGAFAGGTAAANALIDNKAFGITSQVEAAVDANKDTASLNPVEISSNENVNESSQSDTLSQSQSQSKPQSYAESSTASQTQSESRTESQTNSQTESATKSESKSETTSESKSESPSTSETEFETQSEGSQSQTAKAKAKIKIFAARFAAIPSNELNTTNVSPAESRDSQQTSTEASASQSVSESVEQQASIDRSQSVSASEEASLSASASESTAVVEYNSNLQVAQEEASKTQLQTLSTTKYFSNKADSGKFQDQNNDTNANIIYGDYAYSYYRGYSGTGANMSQTTVGFDAQTGKTTYLIEVNPAGKASGTQTVTISGLNDGASVKVYRTTARHLSSQDVNTVIDQLDDQDNFSQVSVDADVSNGKTSFSVDTNRTYYSWFFPETDRGYYSYVAVVENATDLTTASEVTTTVQQDYQTAGIKTTFDASQYQADSESMSTEASGSIKDSLSTSVSEHESQSKSASAVASESQSLSKSLFESKSQSVSTSLSESELAKKDAEASLSLQDRDASLLASKEDAEDASESASASTSTSLSESADAAQSVSAAESLSKEEASESERVSASTSAVVSASASVSKSLSQLVRESESTSRSRAENYSLSVADSMSTLASQTAANKGFLLYEKKTTSITGTPYGAKTLSDLKGYMNLSTGVITWEVTYQPKNQSGQDAYFGFFVNSMSGLEKADNITVYSIASGAVVAAYSSSSSNNTLYNVNNTFRNRDWGGKQALGFNVNSSHVDDSRFIGNRYYGDAYTTSNKIDTSSGVVVTFTTKIPTDNLSEFATIVNNVLVEVQADESATSSVVHATGAEQNSGQHNLGAIMAGYKNSYVKEGFDNSNSEAQSQSVSRSTSEAQSKSEEAERSKSVSTKQSEEDRRSDSRSKSLDES